MLVALVGAGALLRFGTLGTQELWLDEAVTAALMRLDVGEMLATARSTESTPPLYYLLARAWSVPFGTGAVGLRSLSALLGVLTIPVAYAAGATLWTRRAGLAAAALTAVSPALVWYSQEARSYALLVLLAALTVLFTARALRGPGRRDLAAWALCAAAAVLTHYFAGFLVAAEALWLVARLGRAAALPVAAVAAVSAAALPLGLSQSGQGNLDWIGATPLAERLLDSGRLLLVGPTGAPALAVVLAIAVAAALLPLARARSEERAPLVLPLSLLAAAALAPVGLALAGADYVLGRNLLALWLPAALVVAAGASARRAGVLGPAAMVVLVLASVGAVAAVALDRSLQRAAVTAALVREPLDPETQRIVPVVAYALGGPAVADCPQAQEAVEGGAALLAEGGDDPLRARHTGTRGDGYSALAPAGKRDRRVYVYALCVRPLD